MNIQPLGIALGSMKRIIARPIKARLKENGINYPLEHLIILRIVKYCKHSMVQQDIAELLGKNKSVILRMVDALEKDGFICRIIDPNDRRRNILEVTEKGNKLIEQVYDIEMKVTEELLKGLSDNDIDSFYNVLAQIRINSENTNNL